ncbi:hypothetical protein [Salinivirga cyanobacteriivorans]
MKIDQTIEFFDQLTNETQKFSERRRYRQFARMLKELKEKDTSGKYTMVIDRKLDEIQPQLLAPADRKKAVQNFMKFISETLGFVPAHHYISIGVGIGLASGTALGVLIGLLLSQPYGIAYGASIGSSTGLAFGLVIGRFLDNKAVRENRVLKYL